MNEVYVDFLARKVVDKMIDYEDSNIKEMIIHSCLAVKNKSDIIKENCEQFFAMLDNAINMTENNAKLLKALDSIKGAIVVMCS